MSTERTIQVNVEPRPYDVVIRPNLLDDVGALLRKLSESPKARIITEIGIPAEHRERVSASLRRAGLVDESTHAFAGGETHKTLQTVQEAYGFLLMSRIERDTPIIALGGGVVGDVAGFVAATTLRGVPFVQVPTSLLAMVDASVGGKVGVNHAGWKNMIGAFYQPIAVFIDPTVLQTLPARELRNGLAECIKHDLIRDAEHFSRLEQDIGRVIPLDVDFLTDLIAHNITIKARIVEADPLEKGERVHLNFGHTFAHAIEAASHHAYSHGEAVALGMIAAGYASVRLGMLDRSELNRICEIIAQVGLPAARLPVESGAVMDAMRADKKISRGGNRFVLLRQIGSAVVRDDVPESLVLDAIDHLRG